jgi:phosphoribosylamine---glycine ligase
MRILVVGGGGREHALVWRLACEGGHELWCAPGNAGIQRLARTVEIAPTDLDGLVALAERIRPDLTIIGPEAPLAAGLADCLAERGLAAFGPTRAAARLEASKVWAKGFLQRHGIATADADVAANETSLRRLLARRGLPAVIKADGLAAGKGVFVVSSPAEVDAALEALFGLGPAADQVLVEERLCGRELSVLAFVDGERVAVMPPARDYKRLLDGDRGPNTGGMGGYTRPPDVSQALLDQVQRDILEPTVAALAADGVPYRGVLYAGLMLTADGPNVLEYNCRFGDPEAELLLPLLASPLSEVCDAVAAGRLEPDSVRWRPASTCGVVLAAPGYPTRPYLGAPLSGLDPPPDGAQVFHAGTRCVDGQLVTAGGRVLVVVAEGDSLPAARARVYEHVPRVHFEGAHYRLDVGLP